MDKPRRKKPSSTVICKLRFALFLLMGIYGNDFVPDNMSVWYGQARISQKTFYDRVHDFRRYLDLEQEELKISIRKKCADIESSLDMEAGINKLMQIAFKQRGHFNDEEKMRSPDWSRLKLAILKYSPADWEAVVMAPLKPLIQLEYSRPEWVSDKLFSCFSRVCKGIMEMWVDNGMKRADIPHYSVEMSLYYHKIFSITEEDLASLDDIDGKATLSRMIAKDAKP